jgi:hypothetical protein
MNNMKSIALSLLVVLFASTGVFAQSEKYVAAMKKNIADLDSAFAGNKAADLANNFERIANAEKTQWLPYYYAAYTTVMAAYLEQDKSKTDAIADKAEVLIKKAEELAGGENSETCIIKSMIASSHMMVDPMNRWQQYGQASSSNIESAKKLDPSNPRPYLLEGQAKFYTPEQFGGGKSVAKPLFEKALGMFASFKPATELNPSWGTSTTKYFLSQCN